MSTPHLWGLLFVIMYYVYVIKSEKTEEIYIGFANDLKKRIKEHNRGKSFSTKFKLPWQLIYYEAYQSEKDAKLREKRLKYHGRALAQLKRRIKNSLFQTPKVRG